MEKLKQRFNKIKNVFFKEQSRIISAAMSLMVLSILTKFSGMLFTAVFAQKFGAGLESDAFNAANIIPEMVTTILLIGAISGSVIPILIKVKSKESQEYFLNFFNSLLNSGLLVFGIVSVLIIISADYLIDFAEYVNLIDLSNYIESGELRPDEVDGFMSQIANMMRILMIPQAILGFGAYLSSALNVYERFIIPSLAPLFYNLGRIFGAFVLVELMGGSIMGIVWGTIIGSFLHVAVQVPLALHLGINYKLALNLKIHYFKDVIQLGLPRVFSLAGEQISISVSRILALPVVEGALTSFNYALSLVTIPLSLFGATFAIASFPTLSKYYDRGDLTGFSRIFRKVMNQIFFYALPSAVILFILRLPLTRLFYGILGGRFDWADTRQVAWVILFFTLGLPFESLRSLLYRTFYALHDSIRPLISSLLVMVIGILFSVGFSNYFSHYSGLDATQMIVDTSNGIRLFPGFAFENFLTRADGENAVGGLAFSMSVVFILEFLFLMILLSRKKVITNFRKIAYDFSKKIFAGIVIIIFAYIMYKSWANILNTAKTLNVFVLTFSTAFSTGMVYLWVSYVLNIPEVDIILNFFRNYWLKVEKKLPILSTIRNRL